MLDLVLSNDLRRPVKLPELRGVSPGQLHAARPVFLQLLVDLPHDIVDSIDVTSTSQRRQLVNVRVVLVDAAPVMVIELPQLTLQLRAAHPIAGDRDDHAPVEVVPVDRILRGVVVLVNASSGDRVGLEESRSHRYGSIGMRYELRGDAPQKGHWATKTWDATERHARRSGAS